MQKGFSFIAAALAIVLYFPVSTTAQSLDYDPAYGPPKRKSNPQLTVKRLSYENFRNLKLMQAAVLNYGGGEAEIDRLVDQYSEASALYFQNRVPEAADKFVENEKAMLKVSQELAKKYKEDSEKLLNDAMKMSIRDTLEKGLEGKKPDQYAEKYLDSAKFSVQKANDYFDRYINATSASARPLLTAIYYYRRAKENAFVVFDNIDMDPKEKKQLMDQYKRDIEDNKNRVYVSREKQN